MKTPRIADFDANVKKPALKSSLDSMPSIEKPSVRLNVEIEPPKPVRPIERTPVRPNSPSTIRHSIKRIITRNSFETYEDQMEALRRLSYKEKMEGKVGSMSKMVRDAIDEYLEKRASEPE